jgi:hypothetical protein
VASTNRVVQLPAGPPAWAIGSGPVSGYQSVWQCKQSALTKSTRQNCLMLDRFNLQVVG